MDENDSKSGMKVERDESGRSEWDRQQGTSQREQAGTDVEQDQREHQDRGQSEIEKNRS